MNAQAFFSKSREGMVAIAGLLLIFQLMVATSPTIAAPGTAGPIESRAAHGTLIG